VDSKIIEEIATKNGQRQPGGKDLLAIKLMRTGAKKRPSYRIIVKEKQSKRDGAYLENLGTYNPTREPAEIKLDLDRVRYWIEKGAQPTDTVSKLIKASGKEQAASVQPEA
jgi:small subunit ribosomal protein S16